MSRRKKQDNPFRHQLVELMSDRKMTVRKAAAIAQVAPATIVDWRSGGSPADFLAVQRLAEAFNVSLSYLLTGKDEIRARKSPVNVSEVFSDEGMIFDGFAEIKIRRLRPKSLNGGETKKNR